MRLSIATSSPNPDTPSAARILARRHLPLGQAHRALTRAVQGDADVVVEVPKAEDVAQLVAELAACGLTIRLAEPPAKIDVRAVRAKTGYSQDQFALVYGLDAATVRNWEQGRTSPDLTARSYLMTIAADPEGIKALRFKAWAS